MLELYFSPVLLGVNLLMAVAVAATALWYTTRPLNGPGYWMAGAWSLIIGVLLFAAFVATRNPFLNVAGNALQLAGEALFILGIFRFMGRPLPYWILPASVLTYAAFNINYWITSGNSDFLMGVYSTIAGLLPLQAIWILFRERVDSATRPARILLAISLLVYSLATLLRGFIAYRGWLLELPYVQPFESFAYLLTYNFAIPALVMGFIGMSLMTMQRILVSSQLNAEMARESAQRFKRLLNVSSGGIAILKDGLICDANQQLQKMTGRSQSELMGAEFRSLFSGKEQPRLKGLIRFPSGAPQDIEVRRQDNTFFPAELTLEPLTDESGGDYVAELREVSHRKAMENELIRLARIDPLTGSLNRRSFTEAFDVELLRARRHSHAMCLALLDLDHFKSVNDTLGHKAGDDALCQFASLCQNMARGTDVFARFGGEEFVLLMPETTVAGAKVILERIREAVAEQRIITGDTSTGFTVSIGLAHFDRDDTQDSLLQRADQALYEAKENGRNCLVYHALGTVQSELP